ncbi:MAG: hypothetical protein ACHQ2F_08370 [Desulfobaccales bacterium]
MILKDLEGSLNGFNIGLSGAVPERAEWTEPALDRAILEFVAVFTGLVIKYGGRIVHGSHPTFTPIILDQAKHHAPPGSGKVVTLVISELWAKPPDFRDILSWSEIAEVMVIKQVGKGGPEIVETRNKSLSLMRLHLLQQMNIMIAVGGKLHSSDGIIPGVLEEVKYACCRGMACFLIGGMGGMAAKLVGEQLWPWERELQNGLTHQQNRDLQTTTDVSSCVSIIFNHLIQHPELAKRELARLDVSEKDYVNYATFSTDVQF